MIRFTKSPDLPALNQALKTLAVRLNALADDANAPKTSAHDEALAAADGSGFAQETDAVRALILEKDAV